MTYDARRLELHHLANDRSESKDVAKDHPDIVARLTKLALDWKASLPEKPNPECISKEPQQPARKNVPLKQPKKLAHGEI